MSVRSICQYCGQGVPECIYKTDKTCRIYRICERVGFGDNDVLHINNCKHYHALNEGKKH